MKKQQKHYIPEEKVAILRRHLVEGVPISDLGYDARPDFAVLPAIERQNRALASLRVACTRRE